MAARQHSLYDVTLVGPGQAEPERLRCTESELVAIEKKGFTVSERVKSNGKSAFVDASEALGRLLRHAELTDNAELGAKASDAIQALLRGNRFLEGGTSHTGRQARELGAAPPGRGRRP